MFKKFIKELFNNLGLSFFFGIILALILLISYIYLEYYQDLNSRSTEIDLKSSVPEIQSPFIRNFGWFVSIGIPVFGIFLTLASTFFTYWSTVLGRHAQNRQWQTENKMHMLQLKSSFHDRYEKAANMLGNEVMAVRIAGCRALMSLAIDDKNMKVQCVRLLFVFIKNPHLEMEDKGKKLDEVFPINKVLRDDIQEAANSFSAIYEHYRNEGIDNEEVILPDYFLQNEKKKPITLIKANLERVDCEEVYLMNANLQEAELWRVNLQKASLQGANLQVSDLAGTELQWARLDGANLKEARLVNSNLQEARLYNANLQKASLFGAQMCDTRVDNAIFSDADISLANMKYVEGLTKKQVLSAVWGYDKWDQGGAPELPEELVNDPEVQKWLATPHFDLRKKKEGD